MNHSTPGLPVHHQLPEFTQTHVHCRWCHPTISSSVIPFFSCPQSFPASGSFQMSQLFASGSQSTGVSALASVLPMNTQDWSPLEWTGCCPRDSQESSPTPQFKSINSSALSFLYPWATSNSLKLSKTSTPHKSPWPTFQPFLISPQSHRKQLRRLTFSPYLK